MENSLVWVADGEDGNRKSYFFGIAAHCGNIVQKTGKESFQLTFDRYPVTGAVYRKPEKSKPLS